MNFSTIKSTIKDAFIISRYSRTAQELDLLSNAQLAGLGISRELLALGGKAYPWREAEVSQEISQTIPATVTNLKTLEIATYSEEPQKPHTPKAA